MAKAQHNAPKSLSQEILLELLTYEPETGKLFWKERDVKWFVDGTQSASHACKRWNSRYAGKEAFTSKTAKGYLQGRVLDVPCYAHRVICTMIHGAFEGEPDHENGVRHDNRLANLVIGSNVANMRNRAISHTHNTSGAMGVSWHSKYGKWRATIFVTGKHKHLGYFEDINDAIAARKAAEAEHGYHPNHGRKPSLERN